MDLTDRLTQMAVQISKQQAHILTEEIKCRARVRRPGLDDHHRRITTVGYLNNWILEARKDRYRGLEVIHLQYKPCRGART
jgi:hypothetical protein